MRFDLAILFFPDGVAFHNDSDSAIVCERVPEGYRVRAFTRYGEPFEGPIIVANEIEARALLLERWGYRDTNWLPLCGFSIAIRERPAGCTPPYGERWLAGGQGGQWDGRGETSGV